MRCMFKRTLLIIGALTLFTISAQPAETAFTQPIQIRGVELSAKELSRAYNKIKKKYGFHPQLKTVMPSKHRDMRKRKPSWFEGEVISTKGNVIIAQQAGSILAFATTRSSTYAPGDFIELLAWEKGKFSYQPPNPLEGRQSIPLLTDVTITSDEFVKQVTSGYKFKTIDWFYERLASAGNITQTKQKLYEPEMTRKKKNLFSHATIGLVRGTNTTSRDLYRIQDGSVSRSKTKCWNSDKSLPQQLYFTWDSFQRAATFTLHSGYKKKGTKTFLNLVREGELHYFDMTTWRPVPGGLISENAEHHLDTPYPPSKI